MDVMISAFNSVNQSGYFEFVERIAESDHQKKCRIKCNSCGVVFPTWQIKEIKQGRKDNITCPDCGISSDGTVRLSKRDDIAQYYTAGHSAKETAEHFGITVFQLENYVKGKKITNGRGSQEALKIANDNRRAEAEHRLIEFLKTKGFDYLGGYAGKDSKVNVCCQNCGAEFIRGVDSIRKNIVCFECQKTKTHKRHEEEKRARAEAAELRTKEREERNPLGLSYYQLEKERKLDEVCICKECGKEYTPRQYMKSQGLIYYSNSGYCSHECNRKATNKSRKIAPSGKTGNYYKRARKYGCEYIPGITLKKLIKRDGLRCAICGEMCDLNDRGWSEYSGPLYPSVDHIIPMAKGGGHTWNNVQIVHLICNSYKGDNVQDECLKGGA